MDRLRQSDSLVVSEVFTEHNFDIEVSGDL